METLLEALTLDDTTTLLSVVALTDQWDWLSGEAVLALAETNKDFLTTIPWERLCARFFGCAKADTAKALGGWRRCFGAFSDVVVAGEQRRVGVLDQLLRRMYALTKAPEKEAMGTLAGAICSATACAMADEHTRLALCQKRDETCPVAIATAMLAWPDDVRLQERGARSLVYVHLTGHAGHPDCDHAIINAFKRHAASPPFAEAACAYGMAIATEYAKRRNRRLPLVVLERLAAADFYDSVAVAYLARAAQGDHSDLAATYAARALRELALVANVSRSAVLAAAVDNVRDDTALILYTIAVDDRASDHVVRNALSALLKLSEVSLKHRSIYRDLMPTVKLPLACLPSQRAKKAGHRVPRRLHH